MGARKYERQITWPEPEVTDSRSPSRRGLGLGVDIDEEAVAALDLRAAA